MNESELIRMFRQIVRDEIAAISMGNVVSNEDNNRSTTKRFANDGPISNLRNVQPFGVSSKAPPGTAALIIPIDGNGTHLNMVGHFDESRPSGQDGETFLYDAFGHVIYLSQSKLQFGSKASAENMVLGQVFKKLMHDLLKELQLEQHIGNLGYLTSVPQNADKYAALQTSPVDDGLVLSDKAFTEK
jgi:hypothetical protein